MTVKEGDIYKTTDARRNSRYKVVRVSKGYATCVPYIDGAYRPNIQRRVRTDRLNRTGHWVCVRRAA